MSLLYLWSSMCIRNSATEAVLFRSKLMYSISGSNVSSIGVPPDCKQMFFTFWRSVAGSGSMDTIRGSTAPQLTEIRKRIRWRIHFVVDLSNEITFHRTHSKKQPTCSHCARRCIWLFLREWHLVWEEMGSLISDESVMWRSPSSPVDHSQRAHLANSFLKEFSRLLPGVFGRNKRLVPCQRMWNERNLQVSFQSSRNWKRPAGDVLSRRIYKAQSLLIQFSTLHC